MAKATCRMCGNPVSHVARNCPRCGADLRGTAKIVYGSLFLLFLAAVFIWLIWLYRHRAFPWMM